MPEFDTHSTSPRGDPVGFSFAVADLVNAADVPHIDIDVQTFGSDRGDRNAVPVWAGF